MPLDVVKWTSLDNGERHSLRAAGPPALSAALRDLSPYCMFCYMKWNTQQFDMWFIVFVLHLFLKSWSVDCMPCLCAIDWKCFCLFVGLLWGGGAKTKSDISRSWDLCRIVCWRFEFLLVCCLFWWLNCRSSILRIPGMYCLRFAVEIWSYSLFLQFCSMALGWL